MERLQEKERIELNIFEQKTEIPCRYKEKEERHKMDANRDNVSMIQALGGRDNPFVANERQSSNSSSQCSRRDWGECHHCCCSSKNTCSKSSCTNSRSESRGVGMSDCML
jgi:hypothetical protein